MSIAIERATGFRITVFVFARTDLQDGNYAASIADNVRRAGRRAPSRESTAE